MLLAVAVGVLINAAPVLPSPGRWEPDAHRAAATEVAWVAGYLAPGPRVGDRIPNRLWVAWAEGETGWARAYLDRAAVALDQVARRAPTAADRAAVADARGAVRAALRQVAGWSSPGARAPSAGSNVTGGHAP